MDIIGQRFGRWVAKEKMGQNKAGNWLWRCVCDCGNQKLVKFTSLHRGISQSCGCLAREKASLRAKTHGLSNSPTYRSWMAMKRRCLEITNASYANYGGRGISFCERWKRFENFLDDMGLRPPGTSLDRIENDGDYTPENCRWATPAIQHRNTRTNVCLTFRGKAQTLAEWAGEL